MSAFLDRRVRDRMGDAAVVLGVLAFSVLQLVLGGGFGDFADETAEPDGLSFALVLLSALSLLWRDRHPRAVLAVTLVSSLALAAFSYGLNAPPARPRAGRRWCSSRSP